MAMLVTPGFIGSVGLMTRRVRHGGRRSRRISIQRTRIRGHRQLLEQQAKERNECDPGTVVAAAKQHGLMNLAIQRVTGQSAGSLRLNSMGCPFKDCGSGRKVSSFYITSRAPCSLP